MASPLPPAARLVRFDVFELDLRSGELTNNGRRQTLPEQPLALLKALLERRGELVTRDELRHQLWPGDTFVDFEHGLNAAVKRLRDVLGDSADTPRFIETVPRRGYRFVAPVECNTTAASGAPAPELMGVRPSPQSHSWRLQWWQLVPVAGIAILTAVLAWQLRPAPTTAFATAPMRVMPLTSLRGNESVSTYSPSGDEIAFEHGVDDAFPRDNRGIYVMTLGSSEPTRLSPDHSEDQIHDWLPSWSPDGQHIAFLRELPDHDGTLDPATTRIYVVSPFGGPALKVSEAEPVVEPLSWSPDSRWIVAGLTSTMADAPRSGIYLVSVRDGSAQRVTTPTPPATDYAPAFSPDGRTIAYVRCEVGTCGLYVVSIDAGHKPTGPPRILSSVHGGINKVAWGRTGSFLVYDAFADAWISYLWRVDVDGLSPAQRVEIAGIDARLPTTSPLRDQLIFSRGRANPDVYSFESGHDPRPVLTSSFADYDADASPDGRRVAFASARSGERTEIWLANADGSMPQQLTHGPGLWQGSPHWSPDGRQLVFNSLGEDGYWHVWTVDASGGSPRRVVRSKGGLSIPTWSADARAIFYTASVNEGPMDVWRVSVATGVEERLTHTGSGAKAFEWDTTSIVCQANNRDGPLFLQSLAGNSKRQIASCTRANAFYARPVGVFYVGCEPNNPPLHLVDPNTGTDRVLGSLAGFSGDGFNTISTSNDGKVVVYQAVTTEGNGSDLYLIENFR